MFNITKQGSSLLITSNDNSQFPWKDGQMSLPMNSVVYVIDESDYIAFRSASNNDILFTALIDEIQINGTNVTKDDFILQFDNVANSAGGGGGSASAGVNSINGFQGDLTLKSINGQSLIGSGNIEIEGGEGGTAGVNKIILGEEDYGWNTYQGNVKLNTGFTQFDEGDTGYDISVGGTDVNGSESGSMWFGIRSTDGSLLLEDGGGRLDLKVNPDILGGGSTAGVEAINIGEEVQDWTQKTGVVSFFTKFYDGSYDVNINGTSFYGLKPIDDSIVLENAGYTANGNFRCGVKVNEDNFKTINGESIFGTGDITIQGGGGSVTETDPVFTEWKDKTIQVIIGSGATGSDNTQFDNISIGRGARGGNRTIAIGGYSYIDSKFSTSLGTNTKSSADATYSVIIGYSASGNSENSVAIGAKAKVESGVTNGCAIGANTESNATFNTNINNVLKGDTSNYAYVLNEYGNYVKIPTEWTGTQSEYDALGTYYDNITYNIIEG